MKEFINFEIWFYLQIFNIIMWLYVSRIDYRKYNILKILDTGENYIIFQKEILIRSLLIILSFIILLVKDCRRF